MVDHSSLAPGPAGLPVLAYRDQVLATLRRTNCLVLAAPTGSGKSTQVPQFLADESDKKIIVLQPRRIAARALASRVAQETGTPLGDRVGYQVRFENRSSPNTRIVYQTYGVFIQQLLTDPFIPGVSTVILDEFHERSLEIDLVLAWLHLIQQTKRTGLKLIIMSATLQAEKLRGFLPGAELVDIPVRNFPVTIDYVPPVDCDRLGETVLSALKKHRDRNGSVLVFMPGIHEIRKTVSSLTGYCLEHAIELLTLHGSMDLADQQQALTQKPGCRRIIITTNIAESSLTIPDVTLVIDSGLARVAEYDPGRDLNTLYLRRISKQNATQRSGRAGRTGPGACIRLWSEKENISITDCLPPEIIRLELSGLMLKAAYLIKRIDFSVELSWFDSPAADSWQRAERLLRQLDAIDTQGLITSHGNQLIRWPVVPRLAEVLIQAEQTGSSAYEHCCAMTAILERTDDKKIKSSINLMLSGDPRDLTGDSKRIYQQLRQAGNPKKHNVKNEESTIVECWLAAYTDRLAGRIGSEPVYQLPDGRTCKLILERSDPVPELILALDIRESSGKTRQGRVPSRQVTVPVYLPVTAAAVTDLFAKQSTWQKVYEWNSFDKKVVCEERLLFNTVILDRRQVKLTKTDRAAIASIWAEKLVSGEVRASCRTEAVEQLLVRISLGRHYYPDYGFAEMDNDDWLLIYGEAFLGINSVAEVEKIDLAAHILRYIGPELAAVLDTSFPERLKLASGKTGKFLYAANQPPELSARITDFIGFKTNFALCEGRLKVTFNILAPNYRTMQKTRDLAAFWKTIYPELKNQLQRRYPRHPWP